MKRIIALALLLIFVISCTKAPATRPVIPTPAAAPTANPAETPSTPTVTETPAKETTEIKGETTEEIPDIVGENPDTGTVSSPTVAVDQIT